MWWLIAVAVNVVRFRTDVHALDDGDCDSRHCIAAAVVRDGGEGKGGVCGDGREILMGLLV